MARSRVRVRMYRVGFGDCFLVTFPGPQHMLVDCGSLAGDEAMPDVVKDIAEQTDSHIGVVVASHRHGEHVSGFGALAARWNQFRVDEVWMPWTEDPGDATAVGLQRRQDHIAEKLVQLSPTEPARIAANSKSDQRALDVLFDGFGGSPKRRYMSASASEVRTEALRGVHVRVIGPARDDLAVEKLDVGCSLASLSVEAMTQDDGPFGAKWRIPTRDAKRLFRKELKALWLPEAGEADTTEQLCYWLDKTINNTSLFLLLRFGRARLLFPGDAAGQAWGPFTEQPDIAWELARVNFYKVSHHGSHNGTPQSMLEAMEHPASMVSTLTAPWPELPHRPLLRQLAARGPMVRSDRPGRARGFKKGPFWTELEAPGLSDLTLDRLLTPALLIRLDRVRDNLERMRAYLGGDLNRWRPHVKTTKVPAVLDLLLAAGVRAFKCATAREARVLLSLSRASSPIDLLVALAHRGANLGRVAELAAEFPAHRLSILCEDPGHAREARALGLGLFVDLDGGDGRSGVGLDDRDRLRATVAAAGDNLRGLHLYEGHIRDREPAVRERRCAPLYEKLLALADDLTPSRSASDQLELVTSGTPTFLNALAYPGFDAWLPLPSGERAGVRGRLHRVSPGTVVYWDLLSAELGIAGFEPAAMVLTRVTSSSRAGRITCDAGAKAVDAGAGVPCCAVAGWPELAVEKASDEHLPMTAGDGATPAVGSLLQLVPRHVCPTVNLHERAVLLEGDDIVDVVPVEARGHDIAAKPRARGNGDPLPR